MLTDEPNSVYLLVTKDAQLGEAHEDDEAAGHSNEGESEPEPIEGLADTLTVKVSYGSASKEFSLSPVFGEPGAYVAHFIPTAAGTYVFQFRGTIEGMTINETFESGPGRFDDVEEKRKLAFPEPRSSPAEIQSQLEGSRSVHNPGYGLRSDRYCARCDRRAIGPGGDVLTPVLSEGRFDSHSA